MVNEGAFRKANRSGRTKMCASGRSRPDAPADGWPKAVRLLSEGVLDGLQAQVLSGVTESGKAFTMANGIANVRRSSPSPSLAHSPAPHSAPFLFPSARRGVKSALFGLSCCGGKKEESKKRGEKESHLFLSSAQRESKDPRRLWNSTETLPLTASHMGRRTTCG